MAGVMVHRGPDDNGLYVDPACGVSLGVRRLSVIDVAGGHQPVRNEDGTVLAVLNGEIYNFGRLRERLHRAGHVFRSHTDTEVLVHLYEEYGEAFVHAIEGMYALAIWDRNRRRLVIARDRFGEKPLFYTEVGGRLMFASELTALRAGLGAEREICTDAVDAFFVLGYIPGALTIMTGVRQLPPGTLLSWSGSPARARLRRYWSMPARPATRRERIPELAEEGAELLGNAVKSRLVADVPLGVFLSGGLDSTLLASIAASEVSGRLKTFTVGYDTGEVRETLHARATALRLGTDHQEVCLESAEIAGRLIRVIGALDQPNADPALVALHAVAEQARRSVTVAVGGEGADELFGGYPRYRWIERATRAQRVLPARLADGGAVVMRRWLPRSLARLAAVVEPASLATRTIDWVTARRRHLRADVYGPRLRESLAYDTALEDFSFILCSATDEGPVARLMALDQQRYLPDDVLAKADRATMLVSLEMRTPYLSRELAEFSATIPASVHLAGGGKAVLREIARQRAEISGARRAKRAFQVPMSDWLRGPLLPLLRNHMSDGPLVAEGWFDGPRLRAMVDHHTRGVGDLSSVLWPVLVASLWFDASARV